VQTLYGYKYYLLTESLALSQPDVAEIVANLKKSYDGLLEADRKIVNELNKPFAFKRDSNFSREELKEIVEHSKKNYFGKKEYECKKFEDIIQGIADDLGLTSKQVRVAFYAIDKDTFKEMEQTHNKLVKSNLKILKYIKTANYPKFIRILKLNFFWTWILRLKKSK